MKHYLTTGGAGFIGSSLIDELLKDEEIQISCIDNFDDFYSKEIKLRNLSGAISHPRFRLIEKDLSIASSSELQQLIPEQIDAIIHLAAKAGVRPSIAAPEKYLQSNVIALQHLLDFARDKNIPKFIFASSSSVYGANENLPWKETEQLYPISPYAQTKLTGEMMGHVYHHLYGMQFLALRFFTVYGPRQRPDLAIHTFSRNILTDKPIPFYGDGSTSRDYTFIEDIVDGIIRSINYDGSRYEIFNLGNNYTISLSELVTAIENTLGKKAILNNLPPQAGDLPNTYADISKAKRLLGYEPKTNLQDGLKKFADWLSVN